MHNVEIRVFPIASTKVDDAKVREWLEASVEPRLFADFTQSPEGYWVPKYHKV
jgi:hypothetical protein